jgi:hypothetical protein
MNPIVDFFKANKFYISFFMFGSGLAFFLTRNYVDSADLIQYLSLAEQYQKLSWLDIANDFWSPLISWLIIPLNYITGDFLASFKILQWLLVNSGYWLIIFLFKNFSFSKKEKISIHFSIFMLLLSYGVSNGSPDLLYLNILLMIIVLLKSKHQTSIKAIAIGILGGLLYLSKSFGLVFFIIFLLADFIFSKEKNLISFKRIFITVIFFFIFSCAWIIILTKKNHRFTYSGAAEYNFAIMNPNVNPSVFGEIKHPIDSIHFKAPPNKFSNSAWQEPNKFLLAEWSPAMNLKHYSKVIFKNLISLVYYYFNFFVLLVVIFILLAVQIIGTNNTKEKNKIKAIKNAFSTVLFNEPIFVIAAIITSSLYILVLTQKRYLWINEICLLFLILCAIQNIKNRMKSILLPLLCFLILFSVTPDLINTLNSKLNTNWKNDSVVCAMKKDRYSDKIISDVGLGTDGYTLGCAIAFESKIQNFGVQKTSELKHLNYTGYFISEGNNTIKRNQFPLLEFMVYSVDLNCSLYKVKPL